MLKRNSRLEKYIFETLGGIYNARPELAGLNLSNDAEANTYYLGTYFPRSYIEAYNIYGNIFKNDKIVSVINSKNSIEILDIGSGTGGNLIGLLEVLNSRVKNKVINIYSIDGNDIALEYQRKMIVDLYSFLDDNGNIISWHKYLVQFKDKNDILLQIDKIGFNLGFDIIQTFKFANEFYNLDYLMNQGTYQELLKVGEKYLRESGVMVLEDITNPVGGGMFNSYIMNNECKTYFRDYNSSLRYILPKSCAFMHSTCIIDNCFTKKEFILSHRGSMRDITKITYKLFIKEPLGTTVLSGIKDEQCYKISNNVYCSKEYYTYNCYSSPSGVDADAFSL